MVTIKDIAEMTQVSIATVSKIKNGNDQNISQATREKILRTMKETNYIPNAIAKGLKMKQTRNLCFILPDIRNPFFSEIAKGIEDTAWARQFSVTFCNTDNDAKRESDTLSFVQSKMADGVIVTKSMNSNTMDNFANSNIPIVVVDRKNKTASSKMGEVFIDVESAFLDITNHLISRRCKKIAYVSALGNYDEPRFGGFKKALSQAGLPFHEDLVFRSKYNLETGRHGAKKLIALDPDAIVCGNDLIAAGAMAALKECGITVPDQIKVTGFDDIYLSEFLSPPLTTVRQPAYEMGAEAAKMLIDCIMESKELFSQKLDYKLKIRESTENKDVEGGCKIEKL